jgi:phage tail-like protein
MSTYGYSAYDTGYYWNGQFYPTTTQNYYGLQLYSQLSVNPFTATPRDYRTIMVTWTQPQGTWYEFRLVANRYGFPVDQNDGNILIDSTTYPGSIYADQNVIPGTYHYYAVYLRVNNTLPAVWERCAFASCLAPANNALGARMFSLLPTYFQEIGDTELTTDAAGNVYLQQFLSVIGWGFDYLKTQYDVLFRHLNDPMAIPLGDLVNLATEIGMPFQPELPSYVMRKAVANWAHICQLRGTPGGLSEHMTLLTGYPIDLQSGRNKMLENDQAGPLHPLPTAWSASLSYTVGEHTLFGNYLYICIAANGEGTAPTGTTSSNTYWQCVQNVTDPGNVLANPGTVGGLNTWEAIYPSLDAGGSFTSPAGTLVCTQGLQDPVTTTSFQKNVFSVFNKEGSAEDIMLRSVSRITSDMTGTNTTMAPDKLRVVQDGIPLPWLNTSLNGWSSTKRYATNEVVLYDNALYQALRASTGAIPPTSQPLNANPFFNTVTTPWTAYGGATIALSSAQVFQGSDSMLMTPNGSTANPGAVSETFNVIPNATYVANAWVYISTSWADALLYVVWYDAFGTVISTSNVNVSVAATTWTQLNEVVTSPGNAARAAISVQLVGTPANTVLSYWDDAYLACVQTPEWALMSSDGRLRMMLSGYVIAPSSFVQVIPYIEWYDSGGNLIVSNGQNRVVPRTTTPGTAGGPPNLSFDSFTIGIGTYLNGRELDTNDQKWQTQLGGFAVSGFNSGSAYPASTGVRSMAWITGPASTWLGVTFASAPQVGQDMGLIFRAASTSSYWRAGLTGLYLITSGVSSLIATYSTACQPGDRLTVQLNGNNITVYRNGSQVATTTNSTNSSATLHGIVVEATGV